MSFITLISRILSEGGVFEREDNRVDFEGFKARLSTIFFRRFGSMGVVNLLFSSSELSPSSPSSRLSLSPVFARREKDESKLDDGGGGGEGSYHCFVLFVLLFPFQQLLVFVLLISLVLGPLLF